MSILDRIVADKKIEVAHRKSLFPTSYWEASPSSTDQQTLWPSVYAQVLQGLSPNTKDVPLPSKISTVHFR